MATPSSDRKDALLEAGLALASELSLETVLTRIVAVACQLTSARYGALGVLGRDGRISEFITHGISTARRARIGSPPVGRGLLGVLLAEPRPLRLPHIGADPRSVGFPPHHPPMNSFLGAPILAHGRVFGNLYLTEKRGAREFTAADERDLRILASQAGVAIANATVYGEAVSRQLWLERSQSINRAILEGTPVLEVLRMAAAWGRDLLGAEGALIALLRPGSGGKLAVEVVEGLAIEAGSPLPEGLALQALRQPTPVFSAAASPGDENSAVFARLDGSQGPLGVIGVIGRRAPGKLSAEESQVLLGVAAQAAVALEHERAERQRERLALLDERERIARELHDGVIQSLFAVGMGLQAVAANHPEVGSRVERAADELDQVIGDLRNYIFGLRPGVLGTHPLAEALRHLARELEGRSAIVATVEIDEDVARRLADTAEDWVQVTREALSNLSRHSGAASCRIRLGAGGGRAVLTIDDDGAGFDTSAPRPGGQGLENMRARVRRLGGRLTVRSRPGLGTQLRMTIPLD